MKAFEIPYNFDVNLIQCLKSLSIDENLIHCIYISPFQEDYSAAIRCAETYFQLKDMTRDDYICHIKLLNEAFPGKIQLLLQDNNNILKDDKLQFYIDLGIQKYCVGNYTQAKILKEKNKNFEIFGSITMKIQPEDLLNNTKYEKYFDGFVLFWNYNRDLELIKKLPTNYKYILLVNCFCNQKCEGSFHWFMTPFKFLYGDWECPNQIFTNNNLPVPWEQSAIIRPQDLPVFNPYISIYKIQGREYPTGLIIKHFLDYLGDNINDFEKFDYTMQPNEKLYLRKEE